ncbi:hypothetical protein C8N35_11517 [Breoghania corrubedonensis]|uniref:Uncharacterized protein n=1 Tax=Breoghania corrubedonensis TaxID=665038 RepID=A0A2T5UQV4_9HYPH|nr:hypothetical protein [Breoghania corrubedonensis]PTW53897.1 hypothetical protein C8N35_11517 [Breoghania corrubedonensis]
MSGLVAQVRRTVEAVALACDVAPAAIRSPASRRERQARNRAAYALVRAGAGSASDIARALGFADRSGLRHAVLTHAREIGQPVARLEDLMGKRRPRRIDRAKLAFLFAAWVEREGLNQVQAADRLRVSRTVVRKVANAQALDDESLVAVMSAAGLELGDILARQEGGRTAPTASREFYGEHALAGRAVAHG